MDSISCDFTFCVYQQNGVCVLSSIEIDGAGMCGSAISIDLPDEELHRYKAELAAKLESYWDKGG